MSKFNIAEIIVDDSINSTLLLIDNFGAGSGGGAQGAQGAQGPAGGPTGPQGSQGVIGTQ